MSLQSKIEILEESVNEIKELSSQIEATIEDNSFDENDTKNEVTWDIELQKPKVDKNDEEIKDDSIIIESIKGEANRWFDKTYGNTYHQAKIF